MKKALILGCSHAAGSEIGTSEQYERSNSFAAQIAQQQGYETVNMAIPGGSNEAVFRLFVEHAQTFDFVVACWTGSERHEIWSFDHNAWMPMSHGTVPGYPEYNSYGRHWIVHEAGGIPGNLRKARCVLSLNMLAQYWNIPVLNCESFQHVFEFDWPKDVHWLEDKDFCSWCIKENFASTQRGHFGIDAHTAYARRWSLPK